MEKENSPANGSGGLPPPAGGRFPAYASPTSTQEFSHDVSRMPDCPPRSRGHRRAHSEILGLPDDISFDSDLGFVGGGAADGPSLSDEADDDLFSMYINMEKFSSSSATSGLQIGAAAAAAAACGGSVSGEGAPATGSGNERPRVRHQHSQSMDGSTLVKPELLAGGSEGMSVAEAKKEVLAAKLADLALIDPKRAKRQLFIHFIFCRHLCARLLFIERK